MFITLEGGEGAGKTTLITRLGDHLRTIGHAVLSTREPGGTPGAEALRRLLISGATDRWDAVTEVLLLYAARRDHVERLIRPHLADGGIVLCDRFADSTRAYQGHGHGLELSIIDAIHHAALGGFAPDLTLVLDLDPAIGLARAAARPDAVSRFEALDLAFHQRLRAGFLAIAHGDPRRCRVIDAARSADTVFADALDCVLEAVAGLTLP